MLQGISKGKCYVEMSTIDEETMQDVAEVSLVNSYIFPLPKQHIHGR